MLYKKNAFTFFSKSFASRNRLIKMSQQNKVFISGNKKNFLAQRLKICCSFKKLLLFSKKKKIKIAKALAQFAVFTQFCWKKAWKLLLLLRLDRQVLLPRICCFICLLPSFNFSTCVGPDISKQKTEKFKKKNWFYGL